MPARLGMIDAASWDHVTAATITDRRDQNNVAQWSGSVGSLTTGHSGSGRAVVAPSTFARLFKADTFDAVYFRVRFKTSDGTSAQVVADVRSSSATLCFVGIRSSGTGTARALYVDSGFNEWDSEFLVADDTWYWLELAVRIHDTEGAFEVRVDAETVLERSGVDTQPTSGPAQLPDRIRFDNSLLTIDDLVLKTGLGGFSEGDFIGRADGYPWISTLYPDGNGFYSEWDDGTATVYTAVDESQANTSDYIGSNNTGAKHSVTMENLPAAASEVLWLKSVAYSRGGGVGKMPHWLRLGGELDIRHRSNAYDMGTTWTYREREWPDNPRTGKAWTAANVSGLQTVYSRSSAAGTAIDVSQIVIEALWQPTASTDRYPVDGPIGIRSHRHVTCWKITRADGTILRFAAHDQPLTIGGKVYEAVGSFDPSAERREGSLRERNKELVGAITSDAITDTDLRAGRYRAAEVEEFVVDWRYPWAGVYDLTRYWVGETNWSKVGWSAQVNGLTRWLKPKVGDTYGRVCRYTFGEPLCFFQLHGITIYSTLVNAAGTDPRREFTGNTTDISGSLGNSYFDEGIVRWRSGNNWGLESVVKDYQSSTRAFTLQSRLPFDIQAGDLYDVIPGCKRNKNACGPNKWDNFENWGGQHTIPGTDASLQTPSQ